MSVFNTSTIATFADDISISAIDYDETVAKEKFEETRNEVNARNNKWRIKLNETKSLHIRLSKSVYHIGISFYFKYDKKLYMLAKMASVICQFFFQKSVKNDFIWRNFFCTYLG